MPSHIKIETTAIERFFQLKVYSWEIWDQGEKEIAVVQEDNIIAASTQLANVQKDDAEEPQCSLTFFL